MGLAVGLIGCGRWGRNILRDLLALDCDVHVADPDSGARTAALTGGARSACAESGQLPQQLDGIVVASTTQTHHASILSVVDRKLPIFCEKPICPSVDDAEDLLSRDAKVFVMEKWRYHAGVNKLREIAQTESLGKVKSVQTRRVQWHNPHDDVDGVWILGPHDLSIVHHVLGDDLEPRAAVGEWYGDRLNSMSAILGNDPSATISISVREPMVERRVSLHCEQGVAVMDDPLADHIRVYPNGCALDDFVKQPVAQQWPLYTELQGFCEFLRGGPEPLVNLPLAVKMLKQLQQLRDMCR